MKLNLFEREIPLLIFILFQKYKEYIIEKIIYREKRKK